MKQFDQLVIEQAVAKLFGDKHFNICQLDKIGQLVGRNPSQHPTYKFLQALHCVDYADMNPDLVAQLQARVAECLAAPPFNPARLVQQITDEGSNFAGIEDRFIDAPPGDQTRPLRLTRR